MLPKKIVAGILSTILLQFAIAQQTQIVRPDGLILTHAAIDSLVKKLMDTARVTGLAIGILTDNRVNYIKSYGYKNKTTNLLNDTATSLYGASLAKPLFGYIVLQLVDSGLIDLDKPLYTYLPKPLPDYENYRDLEGDNRWKLITARNCLDHTTGFPNWRQFNPKGNGKIEMFFTPGERYAYSGEGIYLLQFVVEIITGRNLEELAREKIFVPFGMYKTSFLWQPSFENDYAVPHDENGIALPKSKRTKLNAAGSMETTIADYTRFMSAVMQGDRLSVKSKTEMLTPQISIYSKHQFPTLNNITTKKNKKIRLSYGLGWGLFFSPYGWAFFKEGHDEGWGHYTIQFPDKGFSLIIMSNSSNGERIFKELVEKIAGVTIPWEWEGYTPYH
jgi:CubicO group peptidase (beta-lactamase class C family)